MGSNIKLVPGDEHVQAQKVLSMTPADKGNYVKYWDHFQGVGARFVKSFQHRESIGTDSYIYRRRR